MKCVKVGLQVMAMLLVLAYSAGAAPITITVGDNDGYGFGVPDNGTAIWTGPYVDGTGDDNRSPGELAAINGAQITDVYSAFYYESTLNVPAWLYTSADVLFPFAGLLTSATLTIDMADFQNQFGAVIAAINGVPLSLAFNDGFQQTVVRSFSLTPEQLAAANLAGQVTLSLDGSNSMDFLAFDYFQLDADVAPVPEPATVGLVGIGLAALARRRLRRTPTSRQR